MPRRDGLVAGGNNQERVDPGVRALVDLPGWIRLPPRLGDPPRPFRPVRRSRPVEHASIRRLEGKGHPSPDLRSDPAHRNDSLLLEQVPVPLLNGAACRRADPSPGFQPSPSRTCGELPPLHAPENVAPKSDRGTGTREGISEATTRPEGESLNRGDGGVSGERGWRPPAGRALRDLSATGRPLIRQARKLRQTGRQGDRTSEWTARMETLPSERRAESPFAVGRPARLLPRTSKASSSAPASAGPSAAATASPGRP
jgi:hypothetical protein